MSTNVTAIMKTQLITVDSGSATVSVVNAGPQGPPGPSGLNVPASVGVANSLFESLSGSPSRGLILGTPVWLLGANTDNGIVAVVDPIEIGINQWTSYDLLVKYINAGSNSGNVRFTSEVISYGDTDTVATQTMGSATVDTVAGLGVVTEISIRNSISVVLNKPIRLSVVRTGSDVGDTLQDSIGILEARLLKVS